MSMALPWQPRVVYNAITLDLTIPMRPPTPVSGGVGGREIAAAGKPAAYIVRRDSLLDVPLRFHESEWASVRAWVEWAQATSSTFTFYPNQLDLSASYSCYLQSPAMGEEFRPTRSEYPSVYELAVQLRAASGAFDVRYFV